MSPPDRPDAPPKDAQEQLQTHGLKATYPRMRVLWMFLQERGKRHWTAEELFRRLLMDGSGIGMPTVYRVLSQLELAGLLRRLRFAGEASLYELNDRNDHDHLVCLDDGELLEFRDEALIARLREVADQRGFELMEHALTLYAVRRR
ncbi:MAG: transcriptional repressor [Burkholderiales bacterium]|nr:transcriptional repressor [Burkholderiales bacterium]